MERRTEQVGQLVNVLNCHRAISDPCVDLLTQFAQRVWILEEEVDSEAQHSWTRGEYFHPSMRAWALPEVVS